jgi:hypothetical protein
MEWPVQAWYFGIFPATLPGSCALLSGSAGFKLRTPLIFCGPGGGFGLGLIQSFDLHLWISLLLRMLVTLDVGG